MTRPPRRYLTRAEFAARIGVKPDTLSRYKLPEPDALTGTVRGWLPGTVEKWEAGRWKNRGKDEKDEG